MRKKALALALAGVGTAAVLGSSTGCNQLVGGGVEAAGALGQLFANVLVRINTWLIYPGDTTNSIVAASSDYVILGTDGSISQLNRNDAADRDLQPVLSCPNGNAILSTGNGTYYFFDAQKKEIRFLGWIWDGNNLPPNPVNLYNEKRELVGVYVGGGANSNGLLVAYCNGQFVVNNNCSAMSNCNINQNMVWNTVVATNAGTGTVYSIKYPSDLKGAFVVDGSNLQESVSVEPGNRLGVGGVSPNWMAGVELDSNNQIVAILFVNLNTGAISRVPMPNNTKIDVTPGSNNPPNLLLMREDGNNVYIAITRTAGERNPRIWYGKFDGTKLTQIRLVDPLGGNDNERLNEVDMDGKGRLYYIEDQNQDTINSVTTDGTVKDASAPNNNNFNSVWPGNGIILPLEDGVVLAYNNPTAYTTYRAGENSLTNVQAGSDEEKAAQNCDNGNILQSGDLTTTCFDSGAGQNEVSYLPNAPTNQNNQVSFNWKIVNPDGIDNNGVLANANVYNGSTLYLRDNQFWYKCPVNQDQCTRLAKVTAAEMPNYSVLPQITTGATVGYISVVDLITDSVTTFNWSYPGFGLAVPSSSAMLSGDLKKAAFSYAQPTSRCDQVGDGNVIVTEDITKKENDPNAQTYTSATVFEDPILTDPANANPTAFQCITSVLNVWTEDQYPSNQQ